MKGELQNTLIQKLNDSLVAEIPRLTRREIRLPGVPGKALAVIGMRRSGKTCFLSQCMADLLAAGAPRESLILLNFEDDRLAGMDASDLSFLLETYYQLHPEFRDHTQITLLLDEIQLVVGWETFARRILDSEKVRLFLSGSSATMLTCVNYLASLNLLSPEDLIKVSFANPLKAINLTPDNIQSKYEYAWNSAENKFVRS